MDNNTFYQKLLLNRYSDIALSSSILIIIGGVTGVIGNTLIIYFYFFRIKERGERYFIPLLAVVDLLGCLTSPPYYIMDNEYLYNYPSTFACRVLSFLQICVPGISAHMLLIISIQRYLLVCRPFGPKMTHFWKRVSFGIVCVISLAYSIPLLVTAGVHKENVTFMSQNVTTEVCKFASNPSPSMSVYVTLLFVLMVVNLCFTTGLYIPVLKRITVSLRFSVKKYEIHRDSNADSHRESSQATCTSEIESDSHDHNQTKNSFQMQVVEINNVTNSPKKVRFENIEESHQERETTGAVYQRTNLPKPTEKKIVKSRTTSAQRRITMMFFVLIAVYVLSYTPPLVITILFYVLQDFTFLNMTRAQTAVWFYMTRLVFLNHIINPLVYGYFDTKFRKELRKLCQ